jgi:hypothetical protein
MMGFNRATEKSSNIIKKEIENLLPLNRIKLKEERLKLRL